MAKYHLVRYYPENEFLLRIAKGDEVSCFMTAIMRHCSDEQRIHIRDMLIERTPKDTKKEKEIAELVGIISNCYHIVIAYANRHGEHLIHPDHANLLLSIQNITQKHNQ